jgi:hypothetical protein
MTPAELYAEAARRGLKLETAGDKLAVYPRGHCPPDFADTLRQHKRQLMDWLEAKTHNLAPESLPWLHVARQVLAGEFGEADSSTRESLIIGLRSIAHPLCRRALARLHSQTAKT